MRFSENRKVAVVVLAVCVLVSIFGFGSIGLARERAKVLTVYDRGADTSLSTRHSMDAYLDSAAENARLMVSEARLHMEDSPVIDKVEELADALASEESIDARYEAYVAMKTAVDSLYDAMYRAVQGSDFTNFKVAYDDFWGCDDLIRHDEYHGLAARFNRLVAGFPGSLVAGISGQGALNTFEG
ncbi:MAG: hypothetical protein Q4C10_02715 [Clostridia bacterium]|nr:hypothetical protein [Clostridia bacterium]